MRRMAELEYSRTCSQHLCRRWPRSASIAALSRSCITLTSSLVIHRKNKRTIESSKTISMSLLFDHEQQHKQKKKKTTTSSVSQPRRHTIHSSSTRLFGRANETCQRLRPLTTWILCSTIFITSVHFFPFFLCVCVCTRPSRPLFLNPVSSIYSCTVYWNCCIKTKKHKRHNGGKQQQQ